VASRRGLGAAPPIRNLGVPHVRTATMSCVSVSASSHGEPRWLTERHRGPVDVCPFRDDHPGDPRLASAMTSLAARYFPAT